MEKRKTGGSGTPTWDLLERLKLLCGPEDEDAPWYEPLKAHCEEVDEVIDWFVERSELGGVVRPVLRRKLRRRIEKVLEECPRCDIADGYGI